MSARTHNRKLVVICDCLDCENKPTWRQGFLTKKGLAIIDLCEKHHFILRTKVPSNIPLDEKVLKWLLIQDANTKAVSKYGIIKGRHDISVMKELDKIELELE